MVAVFKQRKVSLLESRHVALLVVRHGVGIGGGRTESESAVRLIVVVNIDFADLEVPADGKVMLAFYPVQVVVEGIVVAQPARKRRRTCAEKAGDAGGEIGAGGRLPECRSDTRAHSKGGDVLASRRPAAQCDYALVVGDQVIENVGGEGVRFCQQRVLDTSAEIRRVAEQVSGVIDAHLGIVVVVVVSKEVVLISELMVDAGHVFVIGLIRGLEVMDQASELAGCFRSGKGGKHLLIIDRSGIEVGGGNLVI